MVSEMNIKITLPMIAWAIEKNCVTERTAPKPLTLKKYQGGNKNKSIGRLLCIYFADRATIDKDDVRLYLEMTKEGYEKNWCRMKELLERGRMLFEAPLKDPDEPALYFYRKLRIIESALYRRL
jgi:hypothetical protein